MAILEDTIHKLIAERLGVSPDQLTPDLVQEWYETKIAPRLRYEPESEYGGWNPIGLRFVSSLEMDMITREAEAFEEEITSKSLSKKRKTKGARARE